MTPSEQQAYLRRKAVFQAKPKIYRRGYISPETGLIFFAYSAGAKNCEVWLTPEKYAARIENCRAHNARPDFVEIRTKWKRNKYHGDPMYRLAELLRARIKTALRRKSMRAMQPTMEALGCDVATCRAWLERQFLPGMTWANLGKVWHVDHIMPFTLATTPAEVAQLGHYTNTRPLFVNDNLRRPKDGRDLHSPWPRARLPEDVHG